VARKHLLTPSQSELPVARMPHAAGMQPQIDETPTNWGVFLKCEAGMSRSIHNVCKLFVAPVGIDGN